MEPSESSPAEPAMHDVLRQDPRAASNALARRLLPLGGKAAGTLMVHEVYRSIQGESTFAGLPCVFVRLTACHLRCTYCDTRHAFHQGGPMTLDALLDEVEKLGGRLVELTGGEPLLQEEAYPLMATLAALDRHSLAAKRPITVPLLRDWLQRGLPLPSRRD